MIFISSQLDQLSPLSCSTLSSVSRRFSPSIHRMNEHRFDFLRKYRNRMVALACDHHPNLRHHFPHLLFTERDQTSRKSFVSRRLSVTSHSNIEIFDETSNIHSGQTDCAGEKCADDRLWFTQRQQSSKSASMPSFGESFFYRSTCLLDFCSVSL